MNWNTIVSDESSLLGVPPFQKNKPLIGICYPNSYAMAMSNLGFHKLAAVLSKINSYQIFRCFFDPTHGIQTLPVQSIDIRLLSFLFITINYENDYHNLLQMFKQWNISPFKTERSHKPAIIVGGALVSINPQIFSPLADLVYPYPIEWIEHSIISEFNSKQNPSPSDLIARWNTSLTQLKSQTNQMDTLPAQPAHSVFLTPHTPFGNHFLIELARGCSYRCAFCTTPHIYGTFNPFPHDTILSLIKQAQQQLPTKFARVGLVSTLSTRHPELETILDSILKLGLNASLASFRLNDLTPALLEKIHQHNHKTLTLAPETGSEQLRKQLGKSFSNELLKEVINDAHKIGFKRVKLYFIVGLPGETDSELLALIDLLEQLPHTLQLSISVNVFIPKKQSRWETNVMITSTEYQHKIRFIRRHISKRLQGALKFMPYREAALQYHITQGDESLLEGEWNRII